MNLKKNAGILFLLVCSSVVNGQLSMQKKDGGILIVDGQEKVLAYQASPKSKDGEFARCNYIHPLWGVDGKVLTEDFPADHLHHRGVFWAWHQVYIGDKQIGDPWELVDFEQDVVELEFLKRHDGSVQIETEVDWKSSTWKKEGKEIPYLKEKALIVVYPKNGNYRKIDFEIKLLALEEGLRIGGADDEKGYGGFSVRMALPEDVRFAGSKGNVDPKLSAVESPGFVNICGSIGVKQRQGGIVIIDRNQNPGYPQPWILRAKNSMQNAVYPGRGLVPVSTTEPFVLHYSLLVYSGKMKNKKIVKIAGL